MKTLVRKLVTKCGGWYEVRVKDDADYKAQQERSDKDHEEGGRGCHWCKPTAHERYQNFGDGSSLLDHGKDGFGAGSSKK